MTKEIVNTWIKSKYQLLSVRNRSIFISYLLAISSIFFALVIHQQYTEFIWTASPFLMFLPGIIITSWYGGFLPGLVATVVATIVGDYFFLNPIYTLTIANSADVIRLSLFSTVSLLISIINQSFYNQREEKEQILKKLEQSEGRFKRIANSSPVMLWIVNDKMENIFMNTTFHEYLGIRKEENAWMHYIHPDDKYFVQNTFFSSSKTHKRIHFECRLKHKNGYYHWISISGIPNIDEQNVFLGYLGTCVDINDTKHLENQKTTFLSMVAHELRTPLATAQLINQILVKKFSHTKNLQDTVDLENMQEELDSLANLVQELLSFVRGEQGLLPLHIKQFNLSDMLTRVIFHYQQIYPNFFLELDCDANIFIRADAKRIKQVVYNLLDNAIHASLPGNNVEIKVKKEKNKVFVSVIDNGRGISREEQKHIFNRYYQGTESMHKGFGLGLYIAKEMVKKHYGELSVVSELGKGSIFTFSLPVKNL